MPAIVWTTIATGRGPEAHGILSADTRRLTGLRTPVSLDAKTGTLASALGRATDLLRLTRSQPRGRRAAQREDLLERGLGEGAARRRRELVGDLAGRGGERLARERPRGVQDREGRTGRPRGPSSRGIRGATAARLPARARSGAPPRPLPPRRRARAARGRRRGPRRGLPARARHRHDAAARRGARERPRGARRQARRGACAVPLRRQPRSPPTVAELAANEVLVLVGDPGRLARGGRGAGRGAARARRAAVEPGDFGTVSERDIAPTVLHLLGLPRSRELDGQVLEAALNELFRRDHPVRTVDSYGRRPPSRPPTAPSTRTCSSSSRASATSSRRLSPGGRARLRRSAERGRGGAGEPCHFTTFIVTSILTTSPVTGSVEAIACMLSPSRSSGLMLVSKRRKRGMPLGFASSAERCSRDPSRETAPRSSRRRC